MIGNSYTGGNASIPDVSADLQGLFDSDIELSANITKYVVPGGSLKARAADLQVVGEGGLLTNTSNSWDVIVLQEQSNRPGRATKFMGSQLSSLDDGGPILIDLIKENFPAASVVLYNTWSKYPGHPDLVQYFDNSVDEMLSYTNLGYDRIQKNPGSWDHSDIASIARVGDAWRQWYETYDFGGSLTRLHDLDGSHQNFSGSYLAASVIFETITNSSTIGNSYSGTVSGNIGDNSIVALLQQRASATTQVAEIGDFNQDSFIDGQDFLTWQRNSGSASAQLLAAGDGNLDGFVDAEDLLIWQQQYGSTLAFNPAAAVPEPTSLCLAIVLTGCVGVTRRT